MANLREREMYVRFEIFAKQIFEMDVLASLFSRECRVWDYENPCSIGNYIYMYVHVGRNIEKYRRFMR